LDLLAKKEAKTRCVAKKKWQRFVPKSAACRVDYLDFWYRLSSLSKPIPGTDVLPVP
jgi:hypothetical protein